MAPLRDRRPGFSRRTQYRVFIGYVVAVALAGVGGAMLLLSILNPAAFSALTGGVREVTTPVSSALDGAKRGIGSVPGSIASHWDVRAENKRLREQIATDRQLIERARTLTYENTRLRALARIRERSSAVVVSARLVNSSASSTRRFANLNAGSAQGVRRGQPVRGPEGLIGQVTETGPNSARVLLIVDPEGVVPVRRTRDGLAAIASGRGDGLLDVRSANFTNIPILAGDSFVTSGTGGIYPPGIPVARVLKSASDVALARPVARPDAYDFALVLQAFVPEMVNPGAPLGPAPPAAPAP